MAAIAYMRACKVQACWHLLFEQPKQLMVVSVGDSGESASKRQRGRPKGSKNRRTMERQDPQSAVSVPF